MKKTLILRTTILILGWSLLSLFAGPYPQNQGLAKALQELSRHLTGKNAEEFAKSLSKGVTKGVIDTLGNPQTTAQITKGMIKGLNQSFVGEKIMMPKMELPYVDSGPVFAGLQGGFFTSFGRMARDAWQLCKMNPKDAVINASMMVAIPAVFFGFPILAKSFWKKMVTPMPTILEKPQTIIKVDDLAANESEIIALKKIIAGIKNCHQKNHSHVNILFVGSPGTGKTFSANAIANECGIPFYKLYANNIKSCKAPVEEMLQVLKIKQGKSLWHRLRRKKGSIIFIDEIDTFAKQRDKLSEAACDAFSQLLEGSGDVGSKFEGLFIAATNDIKSLDKAILSRFNLIVRFDLPDQSCRKKLFSHYSNKFISNLGYNTTELDLQELAKDSDGFSHRMVAQTIQNMRQKLVSGYYNTATEISKALKEAMEESKNQERFLQASTQEI